MNTKIISQIILGIIGTLCFIPMSCQQNDMEADKKSALHIACISSQPFTTQEENYWKEEDQIAITFNNEIPNLHFTQQNGQWKAERPVYYEDINSSLCTYTATYGMEELCIDQSTPEKYRQSDFLSTDKDQKLTSPKLNLFLKHQSVNTIIHVVRNEKVNADTFDASTLIIHTNNKATITPLSSGIADAANKRSWQAYIPVNEMINPDSGTPLFSLFFDGKEYAANYSLSNPNDVITTGTQLIVTADFNFKMSTVNIEVISWKDEEQSPDGVSPDVQP